MMKLSGKATREERVRVTADALLAVAVKNSMGISADQRVGEADAAALIGMTQGGLKNLRAEGGAPNSYRVSVNGSRISYRLWDLAEWIEDKRQEW